MKSTPWLTFAALACFGCSEGNDNLKNQPSADAGAADAATSADAGEASDTGVADAGQPAPDAGATPSGVRTIPLGTVHIQDGLSAPFTFDLQDPVASFMIAINGPATAWFIVSRLDGPTGLLVSDDGSTLTQLERFFLGPFGAQFKSNNRVTQHVGIDGALFPNNPGVTVGAGQYMISVAGLTPSGQNGVPFTGDVEVTLYVRDQALAQGKLGLHFYFTGASGITSTSAPNNPLIQGAVAKLRAVYGTADIELADPDYRDVDPAFQTIRDLQGTGGDLEQLFTNAQGGGGLHYFFVDRFEGGIPGATVAGIAGGLPGAPFHLGSPGAGVAVAISAGMGDPEIIGHVMAHEGGHWLGLFHTSEITGTEDQHPETPGGMAGNTHLMYPAVGGGTTISPSQATVMRHHAEVEAR